MQSSKCDIFRSTLHYYHTSDSENSMQIDHSAPQAYAHQLNSITTSVCMNMRMVSWGGGHLPPLSPTPTPPPHPHSTPPPPPPNTHALGKTSLDHLEEFASRLSPNEISTLPP